MPPKKKAQSIQTKLSFRPVSETSSKPPFTVESPSPLRPHAAILQMHSSSINSASKVALDLTTLGREHVAQREATIATTAAATTAVPLSSTEKSIQDLQEGGRRPERPVMSTAKVLPGAHSTTQTSMDSFDTTATPSGALLTKDMSNPFLAAPLPLSSSTPVAYHIHKYIKTVVHIDDSDDESIGCEGSPEGLDGGNDLDGDCSMLSKSQNIDVLHPRPCKKDSRAVLSPKRRAGNYRDIIANHLFKRTVVNGTVYEYIPSASMSAFFPPSPEEDTKKSSNNTTSADQGQVGSRHQHDSSTSATTGAVSLGKRKAETELHGSADKILDKGIQREESSLSRASTSATTQSSVVPTPELSLEISSALGSELRPLELDSDPELNGEGDDDEMLVMPQLSQEESLLPESIPASSCKVSSKHTPTSFSSSISSHSQSTAKKTGHSLLDMMATPRGTQPMPRAVVPPRDPKMISGFDAAIKAIDLTNDNAPHSPSPLPSSQAGSSVHAPINLTRSGSSQSDDGFFSSSSLDQRIAPRNASLSQELSPPRKLNRQGSSLSGHSMSGGRTLPPSLTGGHRSVQPVSSSRPSPFGTVQPPKPIMSGIAASFLAPRRPAPTIFESAAAASRGERLGASKGGASDTKGQGRMLTKSGLLFSNEQQYVLSEVVDKGRSVFFTGSAGTGKSVLLKEIITQLQRKHGRTYQVMDDSFSESTSPVAVTASTGIAACNIGGCTLHSFAGVGLGQETLPALLKKLNKNRRALTRWRGTRVLIVDEISMIEAGFLDKLEAIARDVRRSQMPWGGIQVILTGDFFQLPPVSKGDVKFSFEAQCWKTSIHRTIQLQQVFRQKDPVFAKVLNEIRIGKLTPDSIRIFSALTRELKVDDGIKPTELFPLRQQVDEANGRMLASLSGKTMTYSARDRGPLADKMETNCIAPTTLQLKVNAQVMLLRNQDGGEGGLVNGTLGVVIGFVTRPADNGPPPMGGASDKLGASMTQLNKPGEELPLVKFRLDNGQYREMVIGREEWRIELPTGELQGARVQIPLGLAWSLSIHKSQGQTLPKVRVDLARVFEKGQAYVALSRATTLEGLQVLNFKPARVMAHPRVIDFYNSLQVVGQDEGDVNQ